MADPTPGSKEWQDQLNKEIAEHDDQFAKDNPNWEQQHGRPGQSGTKG